MTQPLAIPTLKGRTVLILEDEYEAATGMAREFERLGATVIGPFPTLTRAFEALAGEMVQGAVLDVNVRSEKTYAFADELARRGIPFVFVTGYDALVLPARFAAVPHHLKPVDIHKTARNLFG